MFHIGILKKVLGELSELVKISGLVIATRVNEIPFVLSLKDLWPAAVLITTFSLALFYTLFNVKLLFGEKAFDEKFDWQNFRLHWAFSYLFLIVLFVFLLGNSLGFPKEVFQISFNVLAFLSFLYFLQGGAVVYFWAEKWSLALWEKGLFLIFAFALQILFQTLTWVGLLDTWFDARNRIGKGVRC